MARTAHDPVAVVDELRRVLESSRQARSVRACLVTTRDREHALGTLRAAALQARVPLYHFTVAGRRRYDPSRLAWDAVGGEPTAPAGLIEHAQELKSGLVAIEDCLATLRDDGGDTRVRARLAQMLSPETSSEGLVLAFVEAPEAERWLPSVLAEQFLRLDVPYPRAEELEAIAREEVAALLHRNGGTAEVEGVRAQAARLSPGVVGLTRSAARDALRDALAGDPHDFAGAAERLQARKAAHLGRELAMNILDTADVEEPVGLDDLVEFLQLSSARMRLTGTGRARGVLLIGPPGTGKTMLARSIGKLVGLPVVEFRISSLMRSLLGETERRFAQAFSTLEAMAPSVVFIDEIEKAFGDGGEQDGGTMMRCTGALLSWLSDNPYPNFIVATSNSLRRMGEIGLTMTRSERFDASFFVDVPGRAAREKMLLRWLYGEVDDLEATVAALLEPTERFSGADLRSAIKQARARAAHSGAPLTVDLLRQECQRKRMRALGLYDEFQELRIWGRRYCDPAGPQD
jgi:MoxR-like ATPase